MTIKIYSNIQELAGIGEEWLLHPITKNVQAVFIDGELRCKIPPNFNLNESEVTKIVV